MFSWSKILGLASVAAATALLGMVAFDVPHFRSVYLRINLGNATASTSLANQANNTTNPFVNLGVLGFCTDLPDGHGLQCSPAHIGYSLSGILLFIDGTLPPALSAGVNVVASMLTKVLIVHIIAFGIALISFAFAVLTFIGAPIADCCSSGFCGFAGAAGFAAFVFDIVFFEIIKVRVNEGDAGAAIMGNAMFLTLIAWLLLFITPILFLIGRCCSCCMPKL
ncbi:hypothetical protein B0H14DRAFT_2336876 [Mycena olivaceomarginata]|nr:hypothetical protein B0H14DRAFT_2336876 [Mycena olivaceomarginata]